MVGLQTVSSHENLRSNDSRRLPTRVSLSQGFREFRVKETPVDNSTDKADCIDCVSVCFLCLSETLVGSGGGLQTVFFARKPALKRLASAVRRERPTGRSSYCRRESFEPRLSCERTVCRPDPTSEYVCFLRGSLHCELARRSAKIHQAQLLPRDRAMRRVS